MPLVFDGSDQLTGDFGLYDEPGLPQLEHTLQRFPKLKIFGTDACNVDSDLMPFIRFFKTLRDEKKISGEVYDKIMFKNAQKLFEEN